MKGNMRYFLLYFIIGMSCGAVFGAGLSVALNKIIFFPVCVSLGMVLGALIGIAIKKSKDNKDK